MEGRLGLNFEKLGSISYDVVSLSGKEVVWSWLFNLLYTRTDKPFLAGNESSSETKLIAPN